MAPREARLLEVRKPSTSAESCLALRLPIRFAKKKHNSFWPFAKEAATARDLTRPRWPFVKQISPIEDVLTIGPTISVLVSEKTPKKMKKIRFELELEGARLRGVRRQLVDQVPCDRPPSRGLAQLEGKYLTIREGQLYDRHGSVRNHWVRTVFLLDVESEPTSVAQKTIATIPLVLQIMTRSHHRALVAALPPADPPPDRASGDRCRDLATEVPIKIAFDKQARALFPETFDYGWLREYWPEYRSGHLNVSPMFWFKKQGHYVLFTFDLERGGFFPTDATVANPRLPDFREGLKMLWAGSRESKRLHDGEDSAPVSLVMSGCDGGEGRVLWNEVGGFYLPRATSLHLPVYLGVDNRSREAKSFREGNGFREFGIVDPTYVCDPPEEDPGG